MIEKNNILNWWEALEKNWQDIFEIEIQLNITTLRMKTDLNKQLTESEKKLTELKDDFASNNSDMKILAIINLFQIEDIIIGRKFKFKLENLNPLSPFIGLNKISFYNCEIKDLSALENLNQLKKLEFYNVKIHSNISKLLDKQNNLEIYFEKCTVHHT